MSGWTRSRWTWRQFVQIWLATMLTICRHSTECTTQRESEQDNIQYGRTEQRCIYDCSKSFFWHKWTEPQRIWTRLHWHRSLLSIWWARRQWEILKEPWVVGRLWGWPWDADQEISWNQLQWIQSSWHPHHPSIHKLAMRTHLKFSNEKISVEVLLNGWNLFLPIFAQEKFCFIGKKIRAKSSKDRNPGKWLKVEIIAIKGPMAGINTGSTVFQANIWKLRRPLDTVCLEELPDSRVRTGAPVLWLSCEGQANVWEMFSDNSYLSAFLDRQRLLVAAPVDLRKKKAENFTPQLKKKNLMKNMTVCHMPWFVFLSRSRSAHEFLRKGQTLHLIRTEGLKATV